MDEIWERAVEAALDGQPDNLSTRTLTLDGAVKCLQGRLPPPTLLERFQNLHHLSIANIGVSSLEQFPRLPNLQKLILSDNRITSGLEFLVEAGLDSLRDLDLSNNRIHLVEDLAPLARLKLVSLDLYECPVTRVGEYRSRVFGLIKSLKFLDKTDAQGNERPESDDEDEDEEDDEEDEEEEEEEEDPGSGEVDGDERADGAWMSNGHSERVDGVVDVDEDEESDAEDDESEQVAGRANGFRLQAVNGEEGEDDGEDSESGEEIDEEEVGEDNDVVEVHEIEDSDNEEDGVDDEEDEEEEDDEEEVDNDDDRGLGGSGSTGRLMSAGEIDGHEQGDDDEDNDGETGEDDQGVEDDGEFGDDDDDGEEEDEESGEGYLVQPVSQVEDHDAVGSDIEPINEDNDPDEEEEVEDDLPMPDQSVPSSSRSKRKRDDDDEEDDADDDDDDDDGVDDDE